MKISIKDQFFKKKAVKFNKLNVVVTVSDKDNKEYIKPDLKWFYNHKNGFHQRNKRAGRGRRSGKSIREITGYLDAQRGIYSKAIKKSKGKPIANLANEFASLFLVDKPTEKQERRIQNLAQAIVRNNVLDKRFGKNKRSTIANKGFDMWGVDTGQTIRAIKGHYGGMKRV